MYFDRWFIVESILSLSTELSYCLASGLELWFESNIVTFIGELRELCFDDRAFFRVRRRKVV